MKMRSLKSFGLSEVKLADDYFVNAYEKEVLYLSSFDVDRMLVGFRETAKVDVRGAERYPGWENMLIGGHTLGHYMTACVKCYESANCLPSDRKVLLKKVKKLLVGLKECQDSLGTGFLFGAVIQNPDNVELQFDYVEEGKTNIITEAWVPWYTMHKIFEGLVSAANMNVEELLAFSPEGVDQMEVEYVANLAKEIASRLADWTYGRTSSWSEETHRTVLGIEYGGMNDCLYDVYVLTGQKNHLQAAHAFDQVELFERILHGKEGDNVLNNHHANTTIPKFMGALKRFVVTGDQIYFEYASDFWDKVVEYHSYATGGNSEWEHFGLDNVLDKERTNCNCETCNSYNMLKMTKLLFMITGDGKYADWYEGTFLNSIMSSQNPETGMTTYFQPMASGFFKVYGEPFTKFWCCTGSGMENFSKLQESFFFYKEDMLVVNQYISSSVSWNGYEVKLSANIPVSDEVKLYFPKGFVGKLVLRLPGWLAADDELKMNGKRMNYEIVNLKDATDDFGQGSKGYLSIDVKLEAGAELELTLPMAVVPYNLPDGENTYCFKYGPVLLSALLGTWNMDKGVTGVDVTIPREAFFGAEYLPSMSEMVMLKEGTVSEFMDNINQYMKRQEGDGVSFKLEGVKANLIYVPHYKQHEQRYGIYFKFLNAEKEVDNKQEEGAIPVNKIDTVQPGYGQYESDSLHQMKEIGNGSVGITNDGTKRYAKEGGAFCYQMLVDKKGSALLVTFQSKDEGKSICIKVEDEVIYEEIIEDKTEEYYDVIIPIPESILAKAKKIMHQGREEWTLEFSFSGNQDKTTTSAAICQFLYTIQSA